MQNIIRLKYVLDRICAICTDCESTCSVMDVCISVSALAGSSLMLNEPLSVCRPLQFLLWSRLTPTPRERSRVTWLRWAALLTGKSPSRFAGRRNLTSSTQTWAAMWLQWRKWAMRSYPPCRWAKGHPNWERNHTPHFQETYSGLPWTCCQWATSFPVKKSSCTFICPYFQHKSFACNSVILLIWRISKNTG